MNRIPPVIFLAFANEQGDSRRYLRDIPEELRQVRKALESLKEQGVEVQYDSNATLETVLGNFRAYRDRVAVFHYGGHADSDSLLLEQAEGPAFEVDAAGLHPFLAHQGALRLVFLNGCSTQEQAKALLEALQNGLPTALAEAQLPAVIATSRAIQDTVAREFAVHFYQGLVSGASVQQAFDEAEGQVGKAVGGHTRELYLENTEESTDRWPWTIEGTPTAREWKLAHALNDPTFGLPPLPPGPMPDDRPPGPFRGLQPFRREHAQVFFGRGREIRQLYEHVTDPNYPPVVLLYGQSGVGKSSVLDAGLLPRLERDHRVAYVRYDPELGSLGTLNQALDKVAEAVDEPGGQKPVVVVLDQLDEAITRASSEQAARDDIKGLAEGLPGRLGPLGGNGPRVILGFRKEYLPEIETALAASSIERTKVFLQPLDAEGIVEAIVGPTQSKRLVARYRLSIEKGLPDRIAHDLEDRRNSPVGPTLQLLLTTMYEEVSRKSTTTRHFDGALYQSLEQDYAHLEAFLKRQLATLEGNVPEEEKREGPPISKAVQEAARLGLAVDVLEFHTTGLGTAQQRSSEELREQYAHQSAVLPDLIRSAKDLYLIVDAPGEDEKSRAATRLAHDTLGPLVQEQYRSSGRPGQRARRVLENRAADWKDDQTGALLDDQDLLLVEAGIAGMRVLRNPEQKSTEEPNEESLLARSIQASQARKDQKDAEQRELNAAKHLAEEERKKAEQELNARLHSEVQSNRGLRARFWLAVWFAAIAAVLGIFAVFAAREAAEQSRIATVRQWVAQGQNIGEGRGRLGLLLLSAANKLYDTPETQSALFNALQPLYLSPPLEQIFYREQVRSFKFSPDSKYINTVSNDSDAEASVWRISGFEKIKNPIKSIAIFEFSPDSTIAVSALESGKYVLRRMPGLEILGREFEAFSTFSFSPDSSKFAILSPDGNFTVFRLPSLKSIGSTIKNISDFSFSPDSKMIVATSNSHDLIFYDSSSLDLINDSIDNVRNFSFNSDAKLIAIKSLRNELTIFNLTHFVQIGNPINNTEDFAFSPDATKIAVKFENEDLKIFNLSNLMPIGDSFKKINNFLFSPDSVRLAALSYTDELIIRNLNNLESVVQSIPSVSSFSFSPNSKLLAVIQGDNDELTLRRMPNLEIASQSIVGIESILFSLDSRMLAIESLNSELVVLQLRKIHPAGQPFEKVRKFSFSQNSKILATNFLNRELTFNAIPNLKVNGQKYSMQDSFSFSQDSKKLAMRSIDGKLSTLIIPDLTPIGPTFKNIIDFSFSSDSNYLSFRSINKQLTVVSLPSFRRSGKPFNNVVAFSISPKSKRLATLSSTGKLTLWKFPELTAIGRTIEDVADFKFDPNDLGLLVTRSSKGKLLLWKFYSLERIRRIGLPVRGVDNFLFSPNSNFLAAVSSNYDLSLLELPVLKPIKPHFTLVFDFSFSPDSRYIAVIRAHNSELTLRHVPSLDQVGPSIVGVHTISFSPDSEILAINTFKNRFTLRSIPSLHPISRRIVVDDSIISHGFAFSPDSKLLALTLKPNRLIVWDSSVEGWHARALLIANRSFTSRECDEFSLRQYPQAAQCPP